MVANLYQEEIIKLFYQHSTSILIEILPRPSHTTFSGHRVGWIIWACEDHTTTTESFWPVVRGPLRIDFFTATHI